MQKYYTAVGRFERKGRMGDMTCPMVIINNREYALDIQEMILWAALNWQSWTPDPLRMLILPS